jgi:TonB family protein
VGLLCAACLCFELPVEDIFLSKCCFDLACRSLNGFLREVSGKVVLDFVILPNGHITDARIVASQSTRHNMLRQSALRTLKRANPLPPFPKTLNQPSLRVTLPILYELTER